MKKIIFYLATITFLYCIQGLSIDLDTSDAQIVFKIQTKDLKHLIKEIKKHRNYNDMTTVKENISNYNSALWWEHFYNKILVFLALTQGSTNTLALGTAIFVDGPDPAKHALIAGSLSISSIALFLMPPMFVLKYWYKNKKLQFFSERDPLGHGDDFFYVTRSFDEKRPLQIIIPRQLCNGIDFTGIDIEYVD